MRHAPALAIAGLAVLVGLALVQDTQLRGRLAELSATPAPAAQTGSIARMSKHVVATDKAPAAIGPYSQAIVHNKLVYTAGQIALDPGTMTMVGDGDVARETAQVLANLQEVLLAAGSSLRLCIRCDVFLADMADFAAMNAVYSEHFDGTPPARVTVQAAALPKDARVEIAAIAAVLE